MSYRGATSSKNAGEMQEAMAALRSCNCILKRSRVRDENPSHASFKASWKRETCLRPQGYQAVVDMPGQNILRPSGQLYPLMRKNAYIAIWMQAITSKPIIILALKEPSILLLSSCSIIICFLLIINLGKYRLSMFLHGNRFRS